MGTQELTITEVRQDTEPARQVPVIDVGGAWRAPAVGLGDAWRVPAGGVGGQFVLLALLWAGVGLGPAGWLAGIACAVFTCAFLAAALRRSPRRRLGPAD